MTGLVVLVPLAIEAAAVRRALPAECVVRTGMGHRRARKAAARARRNSASALAVAGFCGAADPALRSGDVVVASKVAGPDGVVACPWAGRLMAALLRRGLPVQMGTVASAQRLAGPGRRRALAASGAVAVDMESAWLADAAAGRPLVVCRVVVEPAGRRLADVRTPWWALRAYRNLGLAAAGLPDWAADVVSVAAEERSIAAETVDAARPKEVT